jgi:hypothetical protein
MTDRTCIRNSISAVESLLHILEDSEVELSEEVNFMHLQELVYLLDELVELHATLDLRGVPATDPISGLELGLGERINQAMACLREAPPVPMLDLYGKPVEPNIPVQLSLF